MRLRRAIEAKTIQQVGLGDGDEFEGALDEYPSASLIAIAAATASKREELESATRDLAGLNGVVSKEVAESFDKNPELGLLLTERVWSDESKRAEPNWTACLDAFQGLIKFADDAGSLSLRAACARASMIVMDEFLNNSETALGVAAEFRESGPNSPLVDLAEIGVRLRRGEGDQSLLLLERVENGTDPRVYALERAMSLTRVLRFLASTSDAGQMALEKMARVVAWGERIGRALDDSFIGNLTRIGFQCERGLLLHCMGQPAEAAEMIERVVSELEEFPDQSFSVFRAIRFRVGQCCGLLGTGRWKGPGDKIPPVSMLGLIADFTDPAPKILDFPAAAYPELWGILAVYAAHAQSCNVARRCARRAREEGKEAYYVAVNQGLEAVYLCDLLEDRLNAAFRSGLEWTRTMAIGMAAGLATDDRIRQRMNVDQLFRELGARVREVWLGVLVGSVLEPLFMIFCSIEGSERPDFGELGRILELHFGDESSGLFDCLALMESGLAVADGNESSAVQAARSITADLSAQNGDKRRLMMLACGASKALSAGELLSYQVAMLSAATKIPQSPWALCFFRMLAKRWLFVVENQKFQLSRPDRSAPKLREAVERALRYLDVRRSAELLIAAADAAALSIPRDVDQELARLAQS